MTVSTNHAIHTQKTIRAAPKYAGAAPTPAAAATATTAAASASPFRRQSSSAATSASVAGRSGGVQISDARPPIFGRVGMEEAGVSTNPDDARTTGRRPRTAASPGSRDAGGFQGYRPS